MKTFYTTEQLVDRLEEQDYKSIAWSLLRLYERQTQAEQDAHSTQEDNGRGFSAYDAELLTDYAKWVLGGRQLTPKMLAVASNKLTKYVGQLLEIVNAKAKSTAEEVWHQSSTEPGKLPVFACEDSTLCGMGLRNATHSMTPRGVIENGRFKAVYQEDEVIAWRARGYNAMWLVFND